MRKERDLEKIKRLLKEIEKLLLRYYEGDLGEREMELLMSRLTMLLILFKYYPELFARFADFIEALEEIIKELSEKRPVKTDSVKKLIARIREIIKELEGPEMEM